MISFNIETLNSATNSYNRGFCRLIPLDKNPGLRPTGVGEVLRRIAGKVIVSVLKEDVIKCTDTLQICVGQEAGIEAAIHSINMMYEDENTDAILLVDASNAFSSLNRQSFLHNISYLYPSIAIFGKNCFSLNGDLWYRFDQYVNTRN